MVFNGINRFLAITYLRATKLSRSIFQGNVAWKWTILLLALQLPKQWRVRTSWNVICTGIQIIVQLIGSDWLGIFYVCCLPLLSREFISSLACNWQWFMQCMRSNSAMIASIQACGPLVSNLEELKQFIIGSKYTPDFTWFWCDGKLGFYTLELT
jgi:hypothetical protein